MYETADELDRLQGLLDRSHAAAGDHLRSITTDERRPSAPEVCDLMRGMRLLVVSTVTADGRPLSGAVDGYLVHGSLWFSSSPDSVRMRHLRARPAVSACHLPGEELAVTAHGVAELCGLDEAAGGRLRQAMLEHYVPQQGSAFEEWLDATDVVCARIEASRMFTFRM